MASEPPTVPEPQPTFITLTEDELTSREIGSHNLQSALEALHRDGLVVLKNAVSLAHLDTLNTRMTADAIELASRPSTHRNFGNTTGNIQQEPVLETPYIFDDVVANPWATQVISCMLGPNPHLRFYSANTAMKATGRQPVHVDIDFEYPRIPFGYCVNINLVDTCPENGATEVWQGTHIIDSSKEKCEGGGAALVSEQLQEERRKVSPPIQASLPKGSLMIRDFRLWHAGRPNLTEDPRVMLVTVQFPHWYRSNLKMRLPKEAKETVNWGDLVPVAEWMDEGWDYLQGKHDHDFSLLP
ncbi:phytanoyl-CoA dioxygenase family protein [Diplogelasinospora grovesii]|uniref:Phytanoyl-CoA dioxygenase family protein n=1 Tax=Diplogelasinospora grovesii TaxID=303347 RepID=A0AAN6N2R6_9PEZI|nr:phytanoyl-CoA dioxygenase family protein [Diplogelasinospora grovesii]